MQPMMRTLLLLLALGLCACSPRATLETFDVSQASGARRETVFVTTSRDYQADLAQFDAFNRGTVRFARVAVSVPPLRQPGEMNLPGRRGVDPAKHFLALDQDVYPDAAAFKGELRPALRARGGEAVIYVHGFNNTMADGVFRIAQLATDLELSGLPMNYAWPSAGNPLGYVRDKESALYARDGLERMIREVDAAGARQLILVAHSMGSLLVMETLRQLAISDDQRLINRIAGVVLISPDIDVELFRSQAQRIGPLPQPFVIFASSRDRALRLSARLTGQRERLGTLSDVSPVADLDVTLLDVSEFTKSADGTHFVAGTSPSLLKILGRLQDVDGAFQQGRTGRAGLLPGTVLTVQNATQVILSPAAALTGQGL